MSVSKCYHFTYLNRAFSINSNGLEPRIEKNSEAIGDRKAKVSYSEGKIGAVGLISNFYTVYKAYKTGERQPHKDNIKEMKQYDVIMKSTSFEEFLGKGMYLIFDGNEIENTGGNTGKGGIYDASTTETILPEKIKVGILRDDSTGKVSYSKFDYAQYLISTMSSDEIEQMPSIIRKSFDTYCKDYESQINNIKNKKISLEEMPLDEFCQKYYKDIVEDLENNKSNVILDSAVRATEEVTKDSDIENQSKVLNKIEKDKQIGQEVDEKSYNK